MEDQAAILARVEATLTALPPDGILAAIATVRGIRIEARLDESGLTLAHNLGGSFRPDKAEATAIIQTIQDWARGLFDSSAAFRTLTGQSVPPVELYVFSGHMDFPVARASDGIIVWYTELD